MVVRPRFRGTSAFLCLGRATPPLIASLARMLDDPKPLVVGVTWVVKCAERHERVDESPYVVDIEKMNVAGVNKVCYY